MAVRKERKAIRLTIKDKVEILNKSGSSDNNKVLELECIKVQDSGSESSLSESE